MFLACRALKDLRLFVLAVDSLLFLGEPLTPCCPNLISFSLPLAQAFTTCDFLGCEGVFLGLLHFILALETALGIVYVTLVKEKRALAPAMQLLAPSVRYPNLKLKLECHDLLHQQSVKHRSHQCPYRLPTI
jgi:hypothetical protein